MPESTYYATKAKSWQILAKNQVQGILTHPKMLVNRQRRVYN